MIWEFVGHSYWEYIKKLPDRYLEEVGAEFQVTRERIRQIEAKALRKLRNPTRSKRLKDFVKP